MMKMIIGAAALTASLVLTPAYAVDFPAAPINHGPPTNLPGEDIIPGLREALNAANGLTQPLLQPVLAPGSDQVGATTQGRPSLHHHHVSRSAKNHHNHHQKVASNHHRHAGAHHTA